MNKRERLLQGVITGIFVLSCVTFFQFFDSGHLFDKEQVVGLSFLSEAVSECMDKPAWLACALAKTLLSLLVPVGGGALLLTIILLLEWWVLTVILKRFNVGEMAFLYALFPVALEWGTYCSPSYHLASILSLVLVLLVFCGYTLIKNKWLSMLSGFALLFIVYSLVGSRLFIFVILVLLYEAEIGEKRWVYWALLLITGTVLPEFLKSVYSLSEAQAYQYPHPWLPAFFPGIAVAGVLVVIQFKAIRNMRANVWSVSVMSGLLILIVISSVLSHAVS